MGVDLDDDGLRKVLEMMSEILKTKGGMTEDEVGKLIEEAAK
jgi:hypothetical protein